MKCLCILVYLESGAYFVLVDSPSVCVLSVVSTSTCRASASGSHTVTQRFTLSFSDTSTECNGSLGSILEINTCETKTRASEKHSHIARSSAHHIPLKYWIMPTSEQV